MDQPIRKIVIKNEHHIEEIDYPSLFKIAQVMEIFPRSDIYEVTVWDMSHDKNYDTYNVPYQDLLSFFIDILKP